MRRGSGTSGVPGSARALAIHEAALQQVQSDAVTDEVLGPPSSAEVAAAGTALVLCKPKGPSEGDRKKAVEKLLSIILEPKESTFKPAANTLKIKSERTGRWTWKQQMAAR